MINEEIMPKVHLVPEAQPRDTNVTSGIIPISQFKINIVSARDKAEGCYLLLLLFLIYKFNQH